MLSGLQMNRIFIDTNLFLRYITNDVPEQAEYFERLLNHAHNGSILLMTNTLVIAEIVWTLKSYYAFSKQQIDKTVSSIVASNAIEIPERQILLQALENFNTLNIDFTDAYIGAWMQDRGISEIYTLNVKDFRRIQGIRIADIPDVPGS